MPHLDDPLWNEILDFYRAELAKRYSPDNLRRFSQFNSLTDDRIATMRDFLLARIYPPAAQRHTLDDAAHQLSAILHSPRMMQPLLRAGLLSAWRMGTRLPHAVSAGHALFDAYKKTKSLEEFLLRQAASAQMGTGSPHERARLIQLLASMPEHDVLRLIHDLLALLRALNDHELLHIALEFMGVCEKTTQKRTDLYAPEDTAAFRLGAEILRDGLQLFNTLTPKEAHTLVSGIEQVELDWYRRIRLEAAGAPLAQSTEPRR